MIQRQASIFQLESYTEATDTDTQRSAADASYTTQWNIMTGWYIGSTRLATPLELNSADQMRSINWLSGQLLCRVLLPPADKL